MKIIKKLNLLMVILFGTTLISYAQNYPDGALPAEDIIEMEYLQDGTGKASLIKDPTWGHVLETSIDGSGKQRSEFVVCRVGSHTDTRFMFHARYISGKGALINQWHQPTRDGKGPAAAIVIENNKFVFNYFKNYTRKGEILFDADKNWHTWRLDVRWSKEDDGYLRLYCDGKLLFSDTGNNSKETAQPGMGCTFKVGTYAASRQCTMHYSWAHAKDLYIKNQENIIYPLGAKAIIDMSKPPYNLDNTGKEDCSDKIIQVLDDILKPTRDRQQAIEKLLKEHPDTVIGFEINAERGVIFPDRLEPSKILYFPNGVYRITKTIEYTITDLQNTLGMELNRQIHFQGQNEQKTIFKLDDFADGFRDKSEKAVISFMKGKSSNIAMSNTFENITIDIGKGNPKAIGLHFFANNTGAVRNVTIKSSDDNLSGHIGLAVLKGLVSGCLFKNITIQGFDVGVKVVDYGIFTVFEHINLYHQNIAGFWNQDNVVSLRKLNSKNNVPAVLSSGSYGVISILDSDLRGENSDKPAIQIEGGMAFIRNVSTSGYKRALSSYKESDVSEYIDEYHTHEPVSLFNEDDKRSLNLPVVETPDIKWHSDLNDWICVDDFGANAHDNQDDTQAIQKAMNSGNKVIYFQPGKYVIDGTITIPDSVERVNFMYTDLIAGDNLKQTNNAGAFKVTGDSETPLIIEDLFAWEAWLGNQYLIEHAGKRTLIMSDLHTQVGSQYFNSVEGGKVFIENVCTTDEYPKRKCFVFRGQKVWARQLNPERSNPEVVNNGGEVWILGFKTESNGTSFLTKNGGKTEVLGGVVNCYGKNMIPEIPMFITRDSKVSIYAASRGPSNKQRQFTRIVEEEKNGANKTLFFNDLPVRRGNNIFIPMYISR